MDPETDLVTPSVAQLRDPRLRSALADTYENYLRRREAAEKRPALLTAILHSRLVNELNELYDVMDLFTLDQSLTALGREVDKIARLIACESQFQPYAIGDQGRSIGPGQWFCEPGNCLWLDTPAGRAGVSRWDVAANVDMVVWVYANRPEWTRRWSCWIGGQQ